MIKESLLKKEIYKERLGKIKSIVISVIFVFSFFLLSGCSKGELSIEEFISKMESKDYSVIDLSDDSSKHVLAVGSYYQVSFYQLESEEVTKNKVGEEVQLLESKNNKISHSKKDHYEKYEIVSDYIYTVYSRVRNTYIVISSTKGYQEDIVKLLDYLGY